MLFLDGVYIGGVTRLPARFCWAKVTTSDELPALIEANFPVIPGMRSISGHSMGGHGALICALKNPGTYRSVSAFAPICNPIECGWGECCFGAYLGDDRSTWEQYDTTCLIKAGAKPLPLMIDQGTDDEFLANQLSALPPKSESSMCGAELPTETAYAAGL